MGWDELRLLTSSRLIERLKKAAAEDGVVLEQLVRRMLLNGLKMRADKQKAKVS